MKIKAIIILVVLLGIIFLSFFSFGLKEKAVKGVIKDIPQYNCDKKNFCTLCLIDGEECSCGKQTCKCGEKIIKKEKCSLF